MITEQKKQNIKLIVAITLLVLILMFVAMTLLKYEVEGEENMPFKLSKIIIISTAQSVDKEESKLPWDFDIYQKNDVNFYIDANEKAKNDDDLLIKSVEISNIVVEKAPEKGTVKAYMPNSNAGGKFVYSDEFLVGEKLTYKGASQSSSTNLEIGSKGGEIYISFCNTDIGNYSSEDTKEQITQDGSLLKKIDVTMEQISYTVSFDIIIETTKNKYKANVVLDMPTGNLIEEGRTYLEKTDMKDIAFKRVK